MDAAEERLEIGLDAVRADGEARAEHEVRQRRIEVIAANVAVVNRPDIGYKAEMPSRIHNELSSAPIGAEGRHVAGRVHASVGETREHFDLRHILSGRG